MHRAAARFEPRSLIDLAVAGPSKSSRRMLGLMSAGGEGAPCPLPNNLAPMRPRGMNDPSTSAQLRSCRRSSRNSSSSSSSSSSGSSGWGRPYLALVPWVVEAVRWGGG